jgi:hypothetical protein
MDEKPDCVPWPIVERNILYHDEDFSFSPNKFQLFIMFLYGPNNLEMVLHTQVMKLIFIINVLKIKSNVFVLRYYKFNFFSFISLYTIL